MATATAVLEISNSLATLFMCLWPCKPAQLAAPHWPAVVSPKKASGKLAAGDAELATYNRHCGKIHPTHEQYRGFQSISQTNRLQWQRWKECGVLQPQGVQPQAITLYLCGMMAKLKPSSLVLLACYKQDCTMSIAQLLKYVCSCSKYYPRHAGAACKACTKPLYKQD